MRTKWMCVCLVCIYAYISLSVSQVKSNHTVKFNRFVKKKKLNKTLQKFILHKICMHNLYTFEGKKLHLVGKCARKKMACRTKISCTTPDQFHPFSIAKINKSPGTHRLYRWLNLLNCCSKSNLDRINPNQRKKNGFEKNTSNYLSIQVLSSTLKV